MSINYAEINRANIYLREKLAGQLYRTGPSSYAFEYNQTYVRTSGIAIGLSLDIKTGKYETEGLHPFFDNLIPEGWLLRHAEKVHKIDKNNRYAILMATGRSPVGAVRVIPLNHEGKEYEADDEGVEAASDDEDIFELRAPRLGGHCSYCLQGLNPGSENELGHHVKCAKDMWGTTRKLKIRLNRRDPLDSFRKTIYGASISGAQRKGLFELSNGVLASGHNLPRYILKPNGDYDQLPENEHVTMVVARELGFDVPEIALLEANGLGRVFAVKRFDIHQGQQLRFEDIGQVLKVKSEDKYESSNEKVALMIKQYSDIPGIDLTNLWRRLLYCFLTGNADMHLKNWSLLEIETMKGLFRLSPCYDLLNTRLPIPKEQIDIGLTLRGKQRNLQWSYYRDFAEELGVKDEEIKSIRDSIPLWHEVLEKRVSICGLTEEKRNRFLEITKARLRILMT